MVYIENTIVIEHIAKVYPKICSILIICSILMQNMCKNLQNLLKYMVKCGMYATYFRAYFDKFTMPPIHGKPLLIIMQTNYLTNNSIADKAKIIKNCNSIL